jgi:hypothetical protein
MVATIEAAAQQARATDAASRPQDRGDFESYIALEARFDLSRRRG